MCLLMWRQIRKKRHLNSDTSIPKPHKYFRSYVVTDWFQVTGKLFSLHMWETICDAWACWSGWNFGPNSTVYPYSVEYPLTPPPPPLPPPPLMKIVRESKSEYRIPPKHENCQRVQVWVQNTLPQMKIVRESKSEYRIPPKNENCQRVQVWVQNTLPQNENCQRVQVWVQNTPPWKLSESPSLSTEYPPPINIIRVQVWVQNTPPPKIGKTSDFQLQNSLKIREIYVETNL